MIEKEVLTDNWKKLYFYWKWLDSKLLLKWWINNEHSYFLLVSLFIRPEYSCLYKKYESNVFHVHCSLRGFVKYYGETHNQASPHRTDSLCDISELLVQSLRKFKCQLKNSWFFGSLIEGKRVSVQRWWWWDW